MGRKASGGDTNRPLARLNKPGARDAVALARIVKEQQKEALRGVKASNVELRAAERELAAAIRRRSVAAREAHELGCTWLEIGTALGVATPTAHKIGGYSRRKGANR